MDQLIVFVVLSPKFFVQSLRKALYNEVFKFEKNPENYFHLEEIKILYLKVLMRSIF